MSTVTTIPSTAPAPAPEPVPLPTAAEALFEARRRITVEEYHRILEAGILGDEPRVELIEGVIIPKMGINPPHAVATDLINDLLHRLVPAGFFVSIGNPVTIRERDSEPEPDAMVVRGQIRDYTDRRRTPADAALVIEVADTSYRTDRATKWAVYAAARVPVYWLLDLNRKRLEIHDEPAGVGLDAYYARTRILAAEAEAPLVLDGQEVARFAVRDILP